MSWKAAYRSMYYQGAPEPDDMALARSETALLVIDVQNTYLETRERAAVPPDEQAKWDLWAPFNKRMREIVIPNTQAMIETFRKHDPTCPYLASTGGFGSEQRIIGSEEIVSEVSGDSGVKRRLMEAFEAMDADDPLRLLWELPAKKAESPNRSDPKAKA